VPDLRSILTLKPKRVEVIGLEVFLARPTVVDLIDISDLNEKDPVRAKLRALSIHVLDNNGERVFPTDEDARLCPAKFAADVIPMIEAMYGEGLD